MPVFGAMQVYSHAIAEIGERVLSVAQRRTTGDVHCFVARSRVAAAMIKTEGTLAIDTVDKAIQRNIELSEPQPVLPRGEG